MKTHTQEKHDSLAEYITRMQKGLGHHSWWYTNRQSEDCINVKMNCWVDSKEVTNLLTKKEKEAVKVLGIDVDEWVENEKWSIIGVEQEYLLDTLKYADKLQKEDARVHDIEWGGRSGGWLAVVFDFDGISDYCEGYEYVKGLYDDGTITKREWSELCKSADSAVEYIELVHNYVKELHMSLCESLEDPQTYIEQLQEYIASCIDSEKEKIDTASQKLVTLASTK